MSFAAAHLPGAINLTPGWVDERARRRIPDLDTEVVVYCQGLDCDSSVQVANRLGGARLPEHPALRRGRGRLARRRPAARGRPGVAQPAASCEHMFVVRDATILHADLDAFYASVEQRDDPRLRGRPVIVGAGVVLAASYEAKAYGIRTAMGGRMARRLCPHAVVVRPRMSAYSEASKAVYEVFDDTTPLVEGLSIDEAFLDVRGLERISGTPPEIAVRLRDARARARRPADHRRRRENEIPRQGRERRRQAGGRARRPAASRAGVPPSARGRAALGRRRRDRGQAARARDQDGGPGRAARRVDARLAARPRVGTSPVRPRAQPRPPPRADRPPARLDRLAVRARPLAEVGRFDRHRSRRPRRPGHPKDAQGRPRRAHRRPSSAFRRLLARDAVAHAASTRRRTRTRSSRRREGCSRTPCP